MTQSPSLGDSTDAQLTTPSNINLRTYFLGVEHHYHDTFISFQFPEVTISTVARIDTPMVHSLNWSLISALLPPVESDPSRKLKRQMFQDAKLDTKNNLKETALNHTDTMFNFLCHATIYANALLNSINTGKINDVL